MHRMSLEIIGFIVLLLSLIICWRSLLRLTLTRLQNFFKVLPSLLFENFGIFCSPCFEPSGPTLSWLHFFLNAISLTAGRDLNFNLFPLEISQVHGKCSIFFRSKLKDIFVAYTVWYLSLQLCFSSFTCFVDLLFLKSQTELPPNFCYIHFHFLPMPLLALPFFQLFYCSRWTRIEKF